MVEEEEWEVKERGREGGREGGREAYNTDFISACATYLVQNRGYLSQTGARCR